jgi:alkylated DNA repair dioxygenase AlkB
MEPCRKHGGRVEGELALDRILGKLTMNRYENFECHTLDEDGNLFFCGELPERLRFDARGFETLWHLHPEAYHTIMIHGRAVATPRWQQAFGADYHYTGRTNRALPLPEDCQPILAWSRDVVDDELNGLLLNWYDGQLGHYIGPHHDSTTRMVVGVPIVTISLGEGRIFRLSHPRTKRRRDFSAREGTVFVMPYETNLAWKHGVPRFARWRGRRISITIRAFGNS